MLIIEPESIKGKIRDILKTGTIDYTRHCRERMYHRDVQLDDILFLLNWGKIEPGQAEDDCQGQVFRIVGTDVEETPLTAVVKIIDGHKLLCVTVF